MGFDPTASERMVHRAALELKNNAVVFVGIGLPNLACNLARATHAPELFMIYESGAVGAIPDRLPVSIGDPALVTDSLSIVDQSAIFQNFLQNGFIEIGFLGGAQIDRYGNINSTVIGPYSNPKVRLPGSGGACEIAVHAQTLLVVMRLNPKSFVETCDFVTSPGHQMQSKMKGPMEGKSRKELNLKGGGPQTVITDLGVLSFGTREAPSEMVLTELFPGVTVEQVKKACAWDLKISPALKQSPEISGSVIRLLREKLDPEKLYL